MSDHEMDIRQRQEPPAHGGRREEAARRLGMPREELLDFSASINPWGPPEPAQAAIRAATAEVGYYPEEEPEQLAAVLAGHLGVFPDELVLGNGSSEVIYWLAEVLRPGRVLIVEPTFSEYRRACEGVGADCKSLQLDGEHGFAFDVDSLRPEDYDLVFVCNPNNPTGYLLPIEDIASLWRRCRASGTGLVVDEAFIEFAGADASILTNGVSRGLYVIRSLTKSHSLAGLRLGCLVAAADAAARLRGRMPPWNINSFAVAAGIAALDSQDFMHQSRQRIRTARLSLFTSLSSIPGIEPLPSAVNFLLCRLEGTGSSELSQALALEGILVRDCRSFAGLGDRYIRVAVRSERENYQLVSALRRILGRGARACEGVGDESVG